MLPNMNTTQIRARKSAFRSNRWNWNKNTREIGEKNDFDDQLLECILCRFIDCSSECLLSVTVDHQTQRHCHRNDFSFTLQHEKSEREKKRNSRRDLILTLIKIKIKVNAFEHLILAGQRKLLIHHSIMELDKSDSSRILFIIKIRRTYFK